MLAYRRSAATTFRAPVNLVYARAHGGGWLAGRELGSSRASDVQNGEEIVERQFEPGKKHQSAGTRDDLELTGRFKKRDRTLARVDQHGDLGTVVPLTLGSLLFESVTRRQHPDGQIGDLERMLPR